MIPVSEFRDHLEARAHDIRDVEIWVGSRWPYTHDRILRDARVWYGDGPRDYQVVWANEVSDGASVPWGIRNTFPTHTGPTWVPALMHDHYYRTGRVFRNGIWLTGMDAKREADRRFHRAMLIYGAPRWRAWCMYRAVSLFGGPAWRENRKNDPTPQPED